MPVRRHTITLATTAPIQFIDLSDDLRAWVQASGVRDGLLTVTSPHTTARITRNEREAELQGDMVRFLESLAPADAAYRHNLETVDGRANAHSHLLGLLMPASESIPVVDGELSMGSWQSLFFVELDGPRAVREVQLQLLIAD
jgi:secondary thiamine-phosphate synthase enzyme